MMPEDTALWQKFIYHGEFLPHEVWYDVRVGRGIELDTGQPDWMKRFAEYSYKKRIDVVGRTSSTTWIIECKPFAGIVALGQVIYYSLAFLAEYRPGGEVIPAIVTDQADPDVQPLFDRFGIEVYEVGVVSDVDQTQISQLIHRHLSIEKFT